MLRRLKTVVMHHEERHARRVGWAGDGDQRRSAAGVTNRCRLYRKWAFNRFQVTLAGTRIDRMVAGTAAARALVCGF
jgi:hypothetical protein